MKLKNMTLYALQLNPANSAVIELPKGVEVTLTAEQEEDIRKAYTIADLHNYGIIVSEAVSSTHPISPAAASTPAAGGSPVVLPVTPAAGKNDGGAVSSLLSLRDIQNKIRRGMKKEEAEGLLEKEMGAEVPRPSVIKELKKVLK